MKRIGTSKPIIGLGTSFLGRSWTPLPQKLIVIPAVYTEEMDATTGWSKVQGSSMVVNNTEFISGTGSIKATSNIGETIIISKAVTWDLSADNGKSLGVWVYPHSDVDGVISFINIYAHNNDWTDIFVCPYYTSSFQKNKWCLLKGGDWVVAGGTPNWATINKIRLVINVSVGQQASVSFDLMQSKIVSKPAVLISFDDGQASTYNIAYSLIKAKKMVATAYVISDLLNSSGVYLTSAQIQEMYANGWDIGNHTKSHFDLTTLTDAQIKTELSACKTFLDGLGLTRASDHVAYPGGSRNATVLEAMRTWVAKTGRLAGSLNYSYVDGVNYDIGATSISVSTDAVSVITNYIDTCVAAQSVAVIYFHGLVASNPTGLEWTTAKFSAVLDYIESLGIQTLTIDEYYRLYSGAIRVNHK